MWLLEKFVQGLDSVKEMWKAWPNIIKGRALYQSVVLRLSISCLGQIVHSRPLSSLVPQRPVSHRNAYELSHMEAMFRMVDNGMGFNRYQCVRCCSVIRTLREKHKMTYPILSTYK